jgi:hypothetical protein
MKDKNRRLEPAVVLLLAWCAFGAKAADVTNTVGLAEFEDAASSLAVLTEASGFIGPAPIMDGDHDGIPDAVDNCIEAFNTDQRDSDGDGFGNMCDADLDNDGQVNHADLEIMAKSYGAGNRHADLNGDDLVNVLDLGIMHGLFGRAPGPTAAND